jgi:selenocysteine lyase/cysteine desulfurase
MSGRTGANGFSRRDFGRLVAGGSAACLLPTAWGPAEASRVAWQRAVQPAPANPGEAYWRSVREQFLLPADLVVMNAANLCPASSVVVQALEAQTRHVDRDPSMPNRRVMGDLREATRRTLAEALRVTPDEIVITRNTSEGNNLVSSGVDLKAGDEVLVCADNHPSLLAAWHTKAKRFGFTVRAVEVVSPHPGDAHYVDAFVTQMNAHTRVVAFSHVTASVGDVFPAREICRAARQRGILSIVDGAQSFGVLDCDLSDMQPDFFTGSAHKWPCGPRENGVLYMRTSAQSKVWPSIISLYSGAVGASRTFEGMGQRDEAAMIAFGEALRFQATIGRAAIERRSRELAQALVEGLKTLSDVKVWTHPDASRSAAIVSFRPGSLDAGTLATALYEKDRIAVTARGGADRGGLRVSPHFYNLHEEVDRLVGAVRKYLKS